MIPFPLLFGLGRPLDHSSLALSIVGIAGQIIMRSRNQIFLTLEDSQRRFPASILLEGNKSALVLSPQRKKNLVPIANRILVFMAIKVDSFLIAAIKNTQVFQPSTSSASSNSVSAGTITEEFLLLLWQHPVSLNSLEHEPNNRL